MKTIILSLLIIPLFVIDVSACPRVDKYPDINCDGKITVLVVGDSLSVGSRERNGQVSDKSSWPRMLQEFIRNEVGIERAEVDSWSYNGFSCAQLVRKVKLNLEKIPENFYDLVIPFCGINDHLKDRTLSQTIHSQSVLNEILENRDLLVMWAKMIPAHRFPSMIEFVSQLQKYGYGEIGFNKIPKSLFGRDGVHLKSRGYKTLARIAHKFIETRYINVSERLKELRDEDNDGVYDDYEYKFGFNTLLYDTDGDGIRDGDELVWDGEKLIGGDSTEVSESKEEQVQNEPSQGD